MPNRVKVLFNWKATTITTNTTTTTSIITEKTSTTTTKIITTKSKNSNLNRKIDKNYTTTSTAHSYCNHYNHLNTEHQYHLGKRQHQIGNNQHRFVHSKRKRVASKSKESQQSSSSSSLLLLIIIIVTMILSEHQSIATTHSNYQPYNALINQQLSLPCNITPPTSDDDVSLILWYRDDLSTPIYTVDARGMANLNAAKHFQDHTVLTDRVTFNITYPISYLYFKTVIESDTAEYRCRVDFRRDRTINRVMQLNVIVPAKKLSIYDPKNNYINDIAGPFNEDSILNLTCESEGGHPLPKVKWWNGDEMISDHNTNPRKGVVRNVIQFKRLLRKHLMMPLTCESSNTNLTVPVTKTILIDLNLKPTEVIIVRPLHNMTVGQRIELVCQSSGSRPPAKISWMKNNKLMEHFSESTSDDGSVTTNFLAFTPTIEDDGKWLSCIAYNPQFKDFQLEDKLQLNIHYAPILSLLLGANAKQQEIIENSSVYFDCNIRANPQVQEFGWIFNGDELTMTSNDNIEEDESTGNNNKEKKDSNNNKENNKRKKIEIRNNSIIIKEVNMDHIGAYQCYASNPLGKTFSEIVNLNVKYAPICANDQEMHYRVQLFERLTIRCDVLADPKDVLFFWEFNSSSINDNSKNDDGNEDSLQSRSSKTTKTTTTSSEKPLMTIDNNGDISLIHFTPRSMEDYGTLYCFAQNRIGRQRKPCIFHISKSETPDAPQNCSLMNVTIKSITVQCNFITNSNDKSDHIQFVLLIYNGLNQLIQNVTTKDNPHFSVTDIDPNDFDNMNLFVYSINQNGQSSDRVRVQANNLVGQPRKLEHIEQRINIKPFLLLMFIVACLITSIGAFIFTLVFKIRRRRHSKNQKQNKNKKGHRTKQIENNNIKSQQQYNCSVFDNEPPPSSSSQQQNLNKDSSSPLRSMVLENTGILESKILDPSYSSMNTGGTIQLGSTTTTSLTLVDSNESNNHNNNNSTSGTIISLDDFYVGQPQPQQQQQTSSCHHLQQQQQSQCRHSHCNIASNLMDSTLTMKTTRTTTPLFSKTTNDGNAYLELTEMNQLIDGDDQDFVQIITPTSANHHRHHHQHHHHHAHSEHCHSINDQLHSNPLQHHHNHHHQQQHVKICNDNNNSSLDDPNLNIVPGELVFMPFDCGISSGNTTTSNNNNPNNMTIQSTTPTPPPLLPANTTSTRIRTSSSSSLSNDPDKMNNSFPKWNQANVDDQRKLLMNNGQCPGSPAFPCIIVATTSPHHHHHHHQPQYYLKTDTSARTINNVLETMDSTFSHCSKTKIYSVADETIEADFGMPNPSISSQGKSTMMMDTTTTTTSVTNNDNKETISVALLDTFTTHNHQNLLNQPNDRKLLTYSNNDNNNNSNNNNNTNYSNNKQSNEQFLIDKHLVHEIDTVIEESASTNTNTNIIRDSSVAVLSTQIKSISSPPPLPPKSAIKVRFVE